MALLNRTALLNLFRKGRLPTEASFENLIDSMVNKIDDGISKSEEFGLQLAPIGDSNKLISFFKSLEDGDHPFWQISVKGKEGDEGIAFEMQQHKNALYLSETGNIGVQTDEPIFPLTVNGFLGVKGRMGTFSAGKISGDGKYHDILNDLKGPQAFEVLARIDGPPKRGKYAMTHAIATCTFGGAFQNKVKHTNSYYGWPWNRIKLRWKGDNQSINLQMKTCSHYGKSESNEPYKIKYCITKLWDNSFIDTLITEFERQKTEAAQELKDQ